jgi:DNA mismatch endonuclease (patch repair protein)
MSHTSFWRRKFARNVERDRLNRRELESMGWTVIEVWEHEVKENPASVAQRVKTSLKSRS